MIEEDKRVDFGPPFWNDSIPLPPQKESIGKYFINSLIYTTNSEFYYICLDKEDNEVKTIKFEKLIENKIERIRNEIEVLQKVDNENIIKYQEIFRYTSFLCIVFPFTPLLSLHQFIENEFPGGIPEKICANIFKKMLAAVGYLHENNIWNRDIKLESFLVFSQKDSTDANNPNIILSNFEYAKMFEEGEKSTEFIGSTQFMAPEIENKVPYNNSVDIWSLGVSLFMMLSGRSPFPDFRESPQDCLRCVSKGVLDYQILVDKNISNEAIELIKNMCQFDPNKRISAVDAFTDPWVLQSNVDPNLVENMKVLYNRRI